MKVLQFIAMILIAASSALGSDVTESTAIGNVQALAGKWKPVDSSRHLLDSKLRSNVGLVVAGPPSLSLLLGFVGWLLGGAIDRFCLPR